MLKGFFNVPQALNEPGLNYGPGSPERAALQAALAAARAQQPDIPMYIGGREIRTGQTQQVRPPHDHQHVLATYHEGDAGHVQQAIEAALAAKAAWEDLPWAQRAAIFLKMHIRPKLMLPAS